MKQDETAVGRVLLRNATLGNERDIGHIACNRCTFHVDVQSLHPVCCRRA
jgi:hypothetical protein